MAEFHASSAEFSQRLAELIQDKLIHGAVPTNISVQLLLKKQLIPFDQIGKKTFTTGLLE